MTVVSPTIRARPTVVSLFSGAGGLDVGLERAGWETVTATDKDAAAIETLTATQEAKLHISAASSSRTYLEGTKIVRGDICDLSASDLRPSWAKSDWRPSLLAGGPPCQPWSSAGLQKGFKDPRGLLIAQMIRVTSELKPRYVLMENVRGLLTASGHGGKHGEALEVLQSEWENLGYAVSWSLLNAADFGAAQRRVRLVMFGTLKHHMPQWPLPTHSREPELGKSLWVSLGTLLDGLPPADSEDIIVPKGAQEEALRALQPGTGLRTGGTIEHQRPGGHWGYRQDSFLADLKTPSRTIRAASTPDWIRIGKDQIMRRLTWRECAALQGFPVDWRFAGRRDAKFRLIGNAVQADMACALGTSLLTALAQGPSRTEPASPAWPIYFHRRIKGAAADHRANAATRKRIAKAS